MSHSAADLGGLFEMSRDAVIGIENEIIAFANPAAEALFPLRTGDPAKMYIPEYILSDSSDRFFASLKLGETSYDATVVRKDGLTLLCVYRRNDARGSSPGWTRALQELGNNLLSARLSIDGITKDPDMEQDPKRGDYACILYRCYYRMKRLHDHMAIACHLAQDDLPFFPCLIPLDDLCRDACASVENLIRAMGISIRFSAPEQPCFVMADAKLLETLLLNLLSNSLLHVQEGEQIAVSLSCRDRHYILAVDDNGSGITSERMAELYGDIPGGIPDAASGAGLGLAVVRGIAERHGGALIMESRPDKGTSLRITLPRPKPEEVKNFRQPERPYRTDGMNVILTELSVVLDKSFYTRKMFD